MKSMILEKGEAYYTILSDVFNGIDPVQRVYNWLITDCEGVPWQMEQYSGTYGRHSFYWVTGDELSDVVGQGREQWVWAVLSGFRKNIELGEVLKYKFPYADGNRGFWVNPVKIQHPLAEVEIVAWDGSCTLVFSKDEELAKRFRKAFPLSQDLEEYNLNRDKIQDQSKELEEWLKKNQ